MIHRWHRPTKLQPSAQWQKEIEARRKQFARSIERNAAEYRSRQLAAGAAAVTYKVGAVLVEFSDTEHYKTDDPNINRPNGYLWSDFQNLLFSDGVWIGGPEPQFDSPHPEGNQVFGSFLDYYQDQSRGNLVFAAGSGVINSQKPDGTSNWILLPHTKGYYDSLGLGSGLNVTIADGNLNTVTAGYDKVAVIYAQEMWLTSFQGPQTEFLNGKYYLVAERTRANLDPMTPCSPTSVTTVMSLVTPSASITPGLVPHVGTSCVTKVLARR